MLNSIRSRATTRKNSTPKATARIRNQIGYGWHLFRQNLGIRLGYRDNEAQNETHGHAAHSFLDCVMHVPTRFPIGVIAISTP